MRSSSSWHAPAAVLIVVTLACLPALVATRGVSGSDQAPVRVPEAEPQRLDPWSALEALAGRIGSAGEEEPPARPLRSLTTAPQRPRVADPGPVRSEFQRRNPRLRIDAPAPDALETTSATPGVRWAAEFRVAELAVEGGDAQRLRVGFVDPAGFRVFTPMVTARSEPLWSGLADGEAVVSFEAAYHLGVRAGDDIRVGDEGRQFRVAGIAALAPADVADVLLPPAAADGLDAEPEAGILVGLDLLRELDEVRLRLSDAGVGDLSVVDADAPFRAELAGDEDVVEAFEPFTFRHRGGGLFTIDPDWIDRNITKTTIPIVGEVMCHRLIIPQLRAALEEIVELELDGLLDPDDFGGCWVPRHIAFDETRALSMHARGIAFDVNVHTNLYGDPPQLDERIVEVFDRHGFDWGGDWRTPTACTSSCASSPTRPTESRSPSRPHT